MGKRQRRRERILQESGPARTGLELATDPIDLTEAAVRSDGSIGVLLISPGWGTRGYYSAELLERDGPTAFPKGTHMYFDHPTATEAADRPERSLRDLAAVLETDARWNPNGPAGPGLYAEAAVFEPYRPIVNEMSKHIGVSIRAYGYGHQGEAEGKRGQIVDEMGPGLSVDFVTHAGRGGQLLQLLESARDTLRPGERPFEEARNVGDWMASRIHLAFTQHADDMFGNGRLTRQERIALSSAIGSALDAFNDAALEAAPQLFSRDLWDEPTTPTNEEADVPLNDEDVTKIGTAVATAVAEAIKPLTEAKGDTAPKPDDQLTESETVAKLREDILLRDARDHAASLVEGKGPLAELAGKLPKVALDRLVAGAAKTATFDEAGTALDKAKLEEALKTAITERAEEIAEATGTGSPRGVGDTTQTADLYEADDFDAKFEESLRPTVGLPPKTVA